MTSPMTQLLAREPDAFAQGDWLIVNPADTTVFSFFGEQSVTVLHQYYDSYMHASGVAYATTLDSRDVLNNRHGIFDKAQKQQQTHYFGAYLTQGRFSDILIYQPKSKPQLEFLLSMAASLLIAGGRLHLVGENKSGIKSCERLLREYGATTKQDAARHCVLYRTEVAQPRDFTPLAYLQQFSYQLNDHEWQVCALPGVFSQDGLDPGTALLLGKLGTDAGKKILDFACGAGVISCYVGSQTPNAQFTMTDTFALALLASAHSLAANGLTASLVAADGLVGVKGKYDRIYTNPPFHRGHSTDYSITRLFIRSVAALMSPSGRLTMVANRFLPYPGLLTECFPNKVQTIAQTPHFCVYEVR